MKEIAKEHIKIEYIIVIRPPLLYLKLPPVKGRKSILYKHLIVALLLQQKHRYIIKDTKRVNDKIKVMPAVNVACLKIFFLSKNSG